MIDRRQFLELAAYLPALRLARGAFQHWHDLPAACQAAIEHAARIGRDADDAGVTPTRLQIVQLAAELAGLTAEDGVEILRRQRHLPLPQDLPAAPVPRMRALVEIYGAGLGNKVYALLRDDGAAMRAAAVAQSAILPTHIVRKAQEIWRALQ